MVISEERESMLLQYQPSRCLLPFLFHTLVPFYMFDVNGIVTVTVKNAIM
jgi:hypothetical protein